MTTIHRQHLADERERIVAELRRQIEAAKAEVGVMVEITQPRNPSATAWRTFDQVSVAAGARIDGALAELDKLTRVL